MEKVSIREFRQRMPFYLNNLPIQLTKNGEIVATISQGENVYTPPAESVYTTKEDKIAALRAAIAPIESKVDKSTGEIKPPAEPERRTYTEYDGDRGEDIIITGTYQDFLTQCGGKKQRATATWKQGKPAT